MKYPPSLQHALLVVSLGLAAPIGGAQSGWRWTATIGSTERAPAYYELYADGLHLATAA